MVVWFGSWRTVWLRGTIWVFGWREERVEGQFTRRSEEAKKRRTRSLKPTVGGIVGGKRRG
ncbi:MAG: hypothetical protein ACI9X4_002964, partial [Glaciecola sp.]